MGKLGRETNFMVRKGNYKLMLTKLAKSNRLDMMYDIESAPFEMKNLVGKVLCEQDFKHVHNEIAGINSVT